MKVLGKTFFGAAICLAGLLGVSRASGATAPEALPPAPPLPVVTSLVLEPATLMLQTGRDERRVLVWGITEDNKRIDVTGSAVLKCEGTNIVVGPQNYLRPRFQGSVRVQVQAAGREAELPVTVESAEVPP